MQHTQLHLWEPKIRILIIVCSFSLISFLLFCPHLSPKQPFFYWRNFAKKEIKIQLFEKEWFWTISANRSGKSNSKNHQIHIFGVHCVAKHTKGWLINFILFLAYSHIWLNLPRDDCHFFYIFQCMVTTLATKKIPKYNNTPPPTLPFSVWGLRNCPRSPFHCSVDKRTSDGPMRTLLTHQ